MRFGRAGLAAVEPEEKHSRLVEETSPDSDRPPTNLILK